MFTVPRGKPAYSVLDSICHEARALQTFLTSVRAFQCWDFRTDIVQLWMIQCVKQLLTRKISKPLLFEYINCCAADLKQNAKTLGCPESCVKNSKDKMPWHHFNSHIRIFDHFRIHLHAVFLALLVLRLDGCSSVGSWQVVPRLHRSKKFTSWINYCGDYCTSTWNRIGWKHSLISL